MKPGLLKHLIIIQAPTITKDAAGGRIETFADLITARAQVLTSGGREFYAAQKINAETSVLFVMRYYSGITAKHRVVHNGVNYDVLAVADPDGRGRWLHLSCRLVD